MNFIVSILRFIGLPIHIEWETQNTGPDGCWHKWTSGMPSKEAAFEVMHADIARGATRNRHMHPSEVKWRVERRIVLTRYYSPKPPTIP